MPSTETAPVAVPAPPTARAAAARHDPLTVAAIAVIVYAAAALAHEWAGHGGACGLVGGVPRLVTSMTFDCNESLLGAGARRWVSAGGTIVTLAVGLLALAAWRAARGAGPAVRFALWLAAAVNLMQGAGYFFFSGVGGLGDWAAVVRGLPHEGAWRLAMAVGGGVAYWLLVRALLRALGPLAGGDDARERVRRAFSLTLPAYAAGAALNVGAGLLNAGGLVLVAISGAAASLGGTSGLAWGPTQLYGRDGDRALDAVPRAWPVVAIAAAVAAGFVLVFGPGVRLS